MNNAFGEEYTHSFDDYFAEKCAKDPTLKQRVEIIGANLDIGSQLYWLREKSGLTQEELAIKIGVPQSAIALWERPGYDSYTLSTLRKLATAFNEPIFVKILPAPASAPEEEEK